MEAKQLRKIQLIIIIACLLVGTLLHFTYDWFGQNAFVGSFSAVNESVWEHLKLAFYPMLLAAVIGFFFLYKKTNNYIEAQMIGIFSAISFITVVYYTYTGIAGTHFVVIDILLFIFSILLGEEVAYRIEIKPDESTTLSKVLSIGILVFLLLCFILCTYVTPKANYFKDPTNGTYGLPEKQIE